jgi:hypothetical protein
MCASQYANLSLSHFPTSHLSHSLARPVRPASSAPSSKAQTHTCASTMHGQPTRSNGPHVSGVCFAPCEQMKTVAWHGPAACPCVHWQDRRMLTELMPRSMVTLPGCFCATKPLLGYPQQTTLTACHARVHQTAREGGRCPAGRTRRWRRGRATCHASGPIQWANKAAHTRVFTQSLSRRDS